MSFILAFQFDTKLLLLASRIQLKVNHMLAPFLDCLHEFDPKKTHMTLVLIHDIKCSRIYLL